MGFSELELILGRDDVQNVDKNDCKSMSDTSNGIHLVSKEVYDSNLFIFFLTGAKDW